MGRLFNVLVELEEGIELYVNMSVFPPNYYPHNFPFIMGVDILQQYHVVQKFTRKNGSFLYFKKPELLIKPIEISGQIAVE